MAKNWTTSLPPTPHKFSRCFTNIHHMTMFSAGIIYELMLSSLDISVHGTQRILEVSKTIKGDKIWKLLN